jgi:excisionase family DNA binding protein
MPDIPQLLTLAEVSGKLRVSSHTIRSWVRRGSLQPVRICRRLLFSPDEIARFLAAAKAQSRQPCQGSGPSGVVTVVTHS